MEHDGLRSALAVEGSGDEGLAVSPPWPVAGEHGDTGLPAHAPVEDDFGHGRRGLSPV